MAHYVRGASGSPRGARRRGANVTFARERAAFVAGDMRKINKLGGYLRLATSIPKIGTHGGR